MMTKNNFTQKVLYENGNILDIFEKKNLNLY
jgi:hypothetical protein